ncbi:hypothetical protein O6H91_14G050700 [Diphasiastrum complanatum]|nr:hypothetical protein O6H91_14G050700 [Diphasiastrum complanatum]
MAASAASAGKVCVTGATGFIATWLVKSLLERGYVVRATVRDLAKLEKVAHLRQLPGASERLELVEAELLSQGSFDAAMNGCVGVFHTASPFFFKNITDPQTQLIDPAVKGTLNVLKACVSANGVKKVVLTSSTAAVIYNRANKSGALVDETWFSDPEYCKEVQAWYVLSKTLAEKAAWDFAKENNLHMVTINPAMVLGRLLQPTLNTSSEAILTLLNGTSKTYPNAALGWVGVKDVVNAHILAYEDVGAFGRYLCVERVVHYSDIANLLSKMYPEYDVPTK